VHWSRGVATIGAGKLVFFLILVYLLYWPPPGPTYQCIDPPPSNSWCRFHMGPRHKPIGRLHMWIRSVPPYCLSRVGLPTPIIPLKFDRLHRIGLCNYIVCRSKRSRDNHQRQTRTYVRIYVPRYDRPSSSKLLIDATWKVQEMGYRTNSTDILQQCTPHSLTLSV